VAGSPFLNFHVFRAEAGRQYKLDVDVVSADAAHRAFAKPWLQVSVWEQKSDRNMWSAARFGLFKLSLRLLYFLRALIGFGLIVASNPPKNDASS